MVCIIENIFLTFFFDVGMDPEIIHNEKHAENSVSSKQDDNQLRKCNGDKEMNAFGNEKD